LIPTKINGAQALACGLFLLGSIASSMWRDSPTLPTPANSATSQNTQDQFPHISIVF